MEERVLRFLETRPDAENIDRLPLTPAQRTAEKADFFLSKRQIVCEVKSLQTDTKEKINRLMQPVFQREDAPVFYGQWRLDKILKHLPDGRQIECEIFDAITSAIQTLFRKSNRQIRTTKQAFDLPHSGGALIIANDIVEVLSPEIIHGKISELFQKKTPRGEFQFPEIEAVWVICETHFVEVSLVIKAMPALLLARSGQNRTTAVLHALQPAWAAAHGVPLLEMDPSLFDTIRFQKQKTVESTGKPIRRYEQWKKDYAQKPYLRSFDETKLGEYFQKLVASITPGFLKSASEEEKSRSMQLMEKFTHFLEEVKERGIDLAKYGPLMQALGAKFKEGQPPTIDLAEIEAFAQAKNVFESGKFYTNAFKKNFRCLQVKKGTATLLLLDMLMGKSLDGVVAVNEPNWQHYWLISDDKLLEALSKRFEQFVAKHPDFRERWMKG